MKIRNGFVSNSSSSSFIVIFPREPKNVEDVKEIIFDKKQKYFMGLYSDTSYPVMQVSETIWHDIQEQKKNDYNAAINKMYNLDEYDYPDAPKYDNFKGDWSAYENASNVYAKKKLKEFFNERKLKLKKINNEDNENEKGVFYIFEYSDNDGEYGAALEHGDLFKKLKFIRISNH